MKRFIALAVVHVVIALELSVNVAANARYDSWLFALFGVLLGQLSLLAVWAGLGNASLRRRCAMVCVAGLYSWAVLVTAAGGWKRPTDDDDLLLLALVIIACVVPTIAMFLSLKRWGPRLMVCSARERPSANAPFQFSIRHLLLLALGVSVALSAGQSVRAIDHSLGNSRFVFGVFCCVLAVCFIHVVLAAVWACLSANKFFFRLPVALLVAALVGLVPPFYFRAQMFKEYLWCLTSAGIAQTVTILSLLVARSAGYRVVRRQPELIPPRAEVAVSGAHPLD